MFPYGETVSVLTPGPPAVDRYGNEADQWTIAATTAVDGCAVAPTSSADLTDPDRADVTSDVTVYLPPDVTWVTSQHRMIVRGETYEINGEPAVWQSPFTGWQPGVEVRLVRVAPSPVA